MNSREVVVLEVNLAPGFVGTPGNTNVNEGVTLTVTNSATDADVPGQVLSYQLVNAPGGAGITTNGVIKIGRAAGRETRKNTVGTVVSEGEDSENNSYEVVVREVNLASGLVGTQGK